MEYVFIYDDAAGNVFVTYPTGELNISATKAKDTPSHSKVVSKIDLPQHLDDFFFAWKLTNNTIEINMDKAKDFTKFRLRAERQPLLDALDVKFQRALEDGASTAEIVAEKRRLRDITLFVDQATTVNQLRALKCSSLALEDPIPDAPHPFTPLDPVTLQPLLTIELIN